jgi:cell division protein ZapA
LSGRAAAPPRQLSVVSISFNNRTYRFACGENEVQRLQDLVKYVKAKLDGLSNEHGGVGDERLILMAALMISDELLDARADIDELLGSGNGELKSLAARLDDADADEEAFEHRRLGTKA